MSNLAYVSPNSLPEALEMLNSSKQKMRIAAGCTNILPDLRSKKFSEGVLVDITDLEELRGIKVAGDTITIGALTTINEIAHEDIIQERVLLLYEACKDFADPLVRNRATIAGNIANSSPASDGVIPILALDTVVNIESLAGKRQVQLDQFFLSPGKNVLHQGEIITSITFNAPANLKSNFIKFGLRNSMAISLASIGVALELNGATIEQIRIALGALAPTPLRARQTENYLNGKEITSENLDKAMEILRGEVNPISDFRASKEYRVHLAGVLMKRAIENALEKGGTADASLSK